MAQYNFYLAQTTFFWLLLDFYNRFPNRINKGLFIPIMPTLL
jgi:hypothetical protein